MVSRRDFLKLIGPGVAGVFAAARGKFVLRAQAQVPGGSLDPTAVPKYVTPLLIPPVMPRAAVLKQGGRPIDYYEISMKQFSQQILPAGLPATTVWGYGAVKSSSKRGLLVHNAPSLTIEAQANRPVRIKWINDLVDANGNYLPHLFAVDPTLHWANPPGGMSGRDTRPTFASTPGPYTGPVPMISHVHGAVGVGEESDGYPEGWYLPAAGNIPASYATEGSWYSYFGAKAQRDFGATWGPGFATFQYPNHNRASTIWYHDHALGITRLNVYAGPAGFYIIRGGAGGDAAVIDTRFGTPAVLPGPAPREGDKFPPNKAYREIPIVIQDRSFHADGSLFYPDSREFFDGWAGPYIPDTDLSPLWNPEFFGNMMMVNGNTWPYLDVEQRRYRFRFLNGCDSRFLILDFSNIPGVEVWQIGNEGGFLAAPVNLTALTGNKLLMTLAERADLIVDFTNVAAGNYVLANIGPDEPFNADPFENPPDPDTQADPNTTGQIMQFRVGPALAPDPTTPPQFIQLPAITPLPPENFTRPLSLNENGSQYWDGPASAMLGMLMPDNMPMPMMWMDEVSENPMVGDTEVWEFYNFTMDAHPIHVHEVTFEVVNRQALMGDGEMAMMPAALMGSPVPPQPWETGFKDTVIAYPQQVTRVRACFTNPGTFVWHCHILSHEDNEMMRPYRIGPATGGPGGGMGM